MAQGRLEMCLALVLMTAMWVETSAQPNLNCMPAITSLSPCLGFITGNSSTPSTSCCTQLASVVQTQAQCLCTVLNGAPQLPFVVNQTQALTLPGACNIQTPPLSQCNAASGSAPPAPAPTSTETPTAATTAPSPSTSTPSVPSGTTTPTTPATPATPSAPSVPSAKGGSKTGSTTGASSSASSSTKFTLPLMSFLVAASVFSSF
ncbi:non-specific lipid-transfer protein-like protein [Iris pallida]|uniref:Non-specific lipid-transfer protein-like protein n=1 Tax=Iris pallida TaxID=29817 RepID=A0AAX6DY06_IRIPA|nr:non-specific lipid-transfer protein-like protein [Iris pallida]KAJ6796616.1 non-specific lipid-transfer protein-like protein [Iris pallida]KAJ6813476.1 non-specific lipid-transfer protein-like protein [Iris pallida]KAJ6846730.1 non-specific lipid-transfer protein-like protein [Iris pallida]KAJ6846731.1 non-specific lipid-transfer protein-like protein [Iris pallida]